MNKLIAVMAGCAILVAGSELVFAQDQRANRGHSGAHRDPGGGGRPHFRPDGGGRHGPIGSYRRWAAPAADYFYPYGYYLPPAVRYYSPPIVGYYPPPVVRYYGPPYYDYRIYPLPRYSVTEYVYPAPVPPPPTVYYESRPLAQAAPPPAPQPAPVPRFDRYTLSAKELFEFDRNALRSAQPKLDEIATVLISNPQIGIVNIVGYTDRLGSDSYNIKLSQRRADAVKTYLANKGVPAHRLHAVGRGKANPVVQCPNMARLELIKCLEPNRRVEVEQFTVERSIY